VDVGLPETCWVFINAYAKATHQTPGEVISFFAQEFLGIAVHSANPKPKIGLNASSQS
jgi:hypothetical protein